MNQLLTKTAPTENYNYQYDNRGNLITEAKDGTPIKTYEYDGFNRMVKGQNNITKEESLYFYNANGKRIRTEQKIKNPNTGYQNNKDSVDNIYDILISSNHPQKETYRAMQKTYEDKYGFVSQKEPFIEIKTDYIIDYTSYASNDIMAYEEGSYVTEYVYGKPNDRISQKVSHIEGFTDKEEGKNPNTSIAVEKIGKLYFHNDRLGSTSLISDKSGRVISTIEYDVWAKVTNGALNSRDMNFAGIDDVLGFTGHTHDLVLDKVFAQARFYDPDDKRFLAEDEVKDGDNWYLYCANNPIMFEDPTGLWAMKTKVTDFYAGRAIGVSGPIGQRKITVSGLNKQSIVLKEGTNFYVSSNDNRAYFRPTFKTLDGRIVQNANRFNESQLLVATEAGEKLFKVLIEAIIYVVSIVSIKAASGEMEAKVAPERSSTIIVGSASPSISLPPMNLSPPKISLDTAKGPYSSPTSNTTTTGTFDTPQDDCKDSGLSYAAPFEEVEVSSFVETIRNEPEKYQYFYARVSDKTDSIMLIQPLTLEQAKAEVLRCGSYFKEGILAATQELALKLTNESGGVLMEHDNSGKGADYLPHYHPGLNKNCHIWYLRPAS